MESISNKVKILSFLWIFNVIAYVLIEYLPKGGLSLGNVRALANILIIIYLLKNCHKSDKISKAIFFYLSYLFILVFFSSNIQVSLLMTIKVFIGTIMFFLGYNYLNTKEKFKRVLTIYLVIYIILLLAILFSNIYGIGQVAYSESEDAILYGSAGVNITKIMLLVILLTPVYFQQFEEKWLIRIILILFFIGLILTIISTKRGSLLGLSFSLLTYFIFARNKERLVLSVLIIAGAIFLTYPIYSKVLKSNYEERQDQFYFISDEATDLEKEARYWEAISVMNSLKNDGVIHFLFGAELFNEFDYFKVKRMLHIDFFTLLSGAGVIGLFLLFRIYFLIVRKAAFYYRRIKSNYYRIIAVSVIVYIVFAQFISISGSIRDIDFRGLLFLYVGSAIGYIHNSINNENTIVI